MSAGATLPEVTFREFAARARRRRWTPESLGARFRGRIPNPIDFFGRALSGRHPDIVIPFRSVIEFFEEQQAEQLAIPGAVQHRLCACRCGAPVYDRKRWATPGCRTRARRAEVTDRPNGDRQAVDFVDAKLRQNRGTATQLLTEQKTGTNGA